MPVLLKVLCPQKAAITRPASTSAIALVEKLATFSLKHS